MRSESCVAQPLSGPERTQGERILLFIFNNSLKRTVFSEKLLIAERTFPTIKSLACAISLDTAKETGYSGRVCYMEQLYVAGISAGKGMNLLLYSFHTLDGIE
ncbi:hypothetical protein QLX67_04625 [Balneolaceae bacterium ANBcel3]|nr:hypothetical protein [Balneolaceae bacterium ANBcel3]